MTRRDWLLSALIFVIAVFMLENFFISLSFFEAIILTVFAAIAIFHTIDVREDFMKKYAKKEHNRRADDKP